MLGATSGLPAPKPLAGAITSGGARLQKARRECGVLRLAIGGLPLVGHPGRARLVVFEARRVLQIVLGFVESEPPLIVFLGCLHR